MANTTVYPFGEGQMPSGIGVINDMTTGGVDKALSAEQGKIIGGALDFETTSETVTERIPYVQNNGYIANSQVNVSTAYRYTDPIFLKAGESLKMKAITPTSVWRLAAYNPDTHAYTNIVSGTSSGTSSASDAYENTYTATDDIYVIVSWYWGYYMLELTKTYTKATTTSKADDIDAINDVLELESDIGTITENVALATTSGKYYEGGIYSGATLGTSTAYSYSDQFLLKKGDVVQITTSGAASSVIVFGVLDGTSIRSIEKGNGTSQTINYSVPLDAYYVVSFLTAQGITVTRTFAKSGKTSARLDDIEDAAVAIPVMQEIVEDLDDAVFSSNSDDMTTGYVEGKFIDHNGGFGANDSFAYKEFSVKAEAVITGQVSSHPNIAILSKRTPFGYIELVAGTAQTAESFTYTATEDMTVAISFNKGVSRTVSINTQMVASNTANIDVLFDEIKGIKRPDYGVLFDKVAVIGDSLTVGTLDAITGTDGHAAGGSYGCSWLTCLAKRWGSYARMHYGRGGTTCYGWIGNNDYGLGLMLKDSVVYDAYFIAYGHNDYSHSAPVGTTSDTPTEVTIDGNNDVSVSTPEGSTTFMGNYKRIVNEIRTKAPNALIFMMSTYDKDSTTGIGSMNAHIKELAEWYYEQGDHKVFFLDYANKTDISRGTVGYGGTGGHFTTFGYAYVANVINECVNDVIEENLNTTALKVWGNYLESYRTTQINETKSGGYLDHL